MPSRYVVRDQGIAMVGFAQLSKALARIGGVGEYGFRYEMRRRIALIGEYVAKDAPQYVTHATGRHGDPNEPTLEESVRVSVAASSASVYSTAIYGGVQNVGGRVGRDHATILKRADVSQWMNQAVRNDSVYVAMQIEELLDWLEREFMAEV
jgi:hypothetical protein